MGDRRQFLQSSGYMLGKQAMLIFSTILFELAGHWCPRLTITAVPLSVGAEKGPAMGASKGACST
jgi:hypothetical protein